MTVATEDAAVVRPRSWVDRVLLQGPNTRRRELALVLRAGALQTPLTIVESRSIGPSLGQDAVQSGIRAGILGVPEVDNVVP